MNLYRLLSFSVGGRSFPWASGYNPLSCMPFLDEMSNEFKIRRFGFWSVNPGPPGMDIDPGGRVWTDFIGNGLGWPSYFVSEKAICDLDNAGIEVWRKTEMPIASIKSKTLQKVTPPKYYVLEAEGGIDVDYEASGIPLDSDGNPNHRARDQTKKGPLAVKLDTWNGKDLFSTRDGVPMVAYCTEKVKKLAEEKGWTNVKFEEIPVV
jgi:hypothetical protein